MPRYFKSTANKPGSGVRKGYRRGGRNLRDEEARVIGVQDNAADELRRVRARRPHDAAERRDRRAQLARVGSRERNARDEMRRLRGYQMGGGIDSLPRPLIGLESMKQPRLAPGQRFITPGPRQAMDFSGSPLLQQQLQQRLAAQQATGSTGPIVAMPRPGEPPRTLRPAPRYVPDQTGTPLQRGASATPWFSSTQRPEYLPDQEAQQFFPWARGGRVSLKTGGRIPRKKKGAKFI